MSPPPSLKPQILKILSHHIATKHHWCQPYNPRFYSPTRIYKTYYFLFLPLISLCCPCCPCPCSIRSACLEARSDQAQLRSPAKGTEMGWPPTTEQSILMAAKLKLKLLAELEVDEAVTGKGRAGRGSSASKGRDRAGRDSSSDRSCISGRSGSGSGTSSGYSGGAGGAVEGGGCGHRGVGRGWVAAQPLSNPCPHCPLRYRCYRCWPPPL
mmetsp:Transcript_25719/g.56891  ORF Transcript_25719/g.56891 Transcript_25719/m.56891 type:complete len:211 (-) Transcript_25719:325-957(-)